MMKRIETVNADPTVLTRRQADVLKLLRDMAHVQGIPPTMQELADHLGVSKTAIFDHIEALEKKGIIRRVRNAQRGITFIDTPARRLAKLVRQRYPDDDDLQLLAAGVLEAT